MTFRDDDNLGEEDMQSTLARPSEDLLELEEIAEILKVARKTLLKWRYAGTGPPLVKYGKALKIRRAALDQWILEQENN